MHEALEAAIRYAFDELRLHRIMANYVPTNERSGRVLRRLGFVIEGYARDYLFIGGRFMDHVLTSLTNPKLANAERLCTPRV
jgi:ribosomal-protein-alanine N-acetyltransferase